jgi:hypothetical protein
LSLEQPSLMAPAAAKMRMPEFLRQVCVAGWWLTVVSTPSVLFLFGLFLAEELLELPELRGGARLSQSIESALSAHAGCRVVLDVLPNPCKWSEDTFDQRRASRAGATPSVAVSLLKSRALAQAPKFPSEKTYTRIAPERWSMTDVSSELMASPGSRELRSTRKTLRR